eukprot:CFRG4096T1
MSIPMTVAAALLAAQFNATMPPPQTEVYVCRDANFAECSSLSTLQVGGPVPYIALRSMWVGAAAHLRVISEGVQTYNFDYVPVGGYRSNGQYPNLEPELWSTIESSGQQSNISFFVEPFSEDFVYFERGSPGCSQDPWTGASTLLKTGVYDVIPAWAASHHLNTPNSIDNNSIPNSQNVSAPNRLHVGAGVTATLYSGENQIGESVTLVGPATLCLDGPIQNADNATVTSVMSFILAETWSSISGSWVQIFQPSNAEIQEEIFAGYEFGDTKIIADRFEKSFLAGLDQGFNFVEKNKELVLRFDAFTAKELATALETSFVRQTSSVSIGLCIAPYEYSKEQNGTPYNFVAMYQWRMQGYSLQDTIKPTATVLSLNYLCIYHRTSKVPWPKCVLFNCADAFCQTCI